MGGFYSAEGHEVCSFGDETTYYPCAGTPPSAADAQLIAAAPMLLKFAEWILSRAHDESQEAIRARAAIAAATGEA